MDKYTAEQAWQDTMVYKTSSVINVIKSAAMTGSSSTSVYVTKEEAEFLKSLGYDVGAFHFYGNDRVTVTVSWNKTFSN